MPRHKRATTSAQTPAGSTRRTLGSSALRVRPSIALKPRFSSKVRLSVNTIDADAHDVASTPHVHRIHGEEYPNRPESRRSVRIVSALPAETSQLFGVNLVVREAPRVDVVLDALAGRLVSLAANVVNQLVARHGDEPRVLA